MAGTCEDRNVPATGDVSNVSDQHSLGTPLSNVGGASEGSASAAHTEAMQLEVSNPLSTESDGGLGCSIQSYDTNNDLRRKRRRERLLVEKSGVESGNTHAEGVGGSENVVLDMDQPAKAVAVAEAGKVLRGRSDDKGKHSREGYEVTADVPREEITRGTANSPEIRKCPKGRLLDLHPWAAELRKPKEVQLEKPKFSLQERFGKFLKKDEEDEKK
ncbi:hypothetical protein M758_UG101900 [Ceratodon purpureus]|nr:hypothetical protein M758_UG101900 [Ceratodon purpureus]